MSVSLPLMRIDRLSFSGSKRSQVTVPYVSGLNILWGASDHGKTFSAQSIDFVFGSKGPLGKNYLTLPQEGQGIDRCSLWVTIGKSRFTLQRAIAGGAIEVADGHHDLIGPQNTNYRKLSAKHSDSVSSLSGFLLEELAFRQAQLLKNERAQKVSFTFRMLMRYLLIDETRIFSRESVIMRKGDQPTAEDKSLLKFLITGVDGSAVATVATSAEQKAARGAKVDVLRELVSELSSGLREEQSDEELSGAISAAEDVRSDSNSALRAHQETTDRKRLEVNELRKELKETEEKAADYRAMNIRFRELDRTLRSDIDRLAGLEEGGFLLGKFAEMTCPLCGADPQHQNHAHRLQHVQEQQLATQAEIAKIRSERAELQTAIQGLIADVQATDQTITTLEMIVRAEREDLLHLQNDDRGVRDRFVEADEKLQSLTAERDRRAEIQRLEIKIAELSKLKVPARPIAENFNPSLSTNEAHDLAKVVKRVLLAWGYPGVETVTFDLSSQDLIVDGKERRTNGKGVRAILHSAFKVAVLIYCREQNLPHPGFLILDTPLLAYREPKDDDVMEEDESELAKSGLAGRFYAHLASLSDIGQFIVIENATPPRDLPKSVKQIQFDGGKGLFS